MIEYLYNAIRATAGQDITVVAEITNDTEIPITEGCHIMLFDPEKEMIGTFDGEYDIKDNEWSFTIPAETTKGLSGRYWYSIYHYDNSLCFKEPIYLV